MTLIYILLILPIVQAAFYKKTDSEKIGNNNNDLSQTRNMASLLQCVHHCKRVDKSAEVLFYNGLCQCIKLIGEEKEKTLSGSFIKKVEMKEIKDYALKKPAGHSSLIYQAYAHLANDGDLGTVQSTKNGFNYWYVDMQKEVWISYIKIKWNNWELNVEKSANSLKILTKTSPNSKYKVCTYIGRPTSLQFQVTCDSLTKARFVKLTNNGRVAIHDFRVFGYV